MAATVVIAPEPALIGGPWGRSIAHALADGYQPAMMVMAAPYAVAAIVTGLRDGARSSLARIPP
ncbi:MAG: hypothetical protein JO037_02345 [Actinobacteria bacterium]|nr:hypothetical protein [Actinomycetota bacterium]